MIAARAMTLGVAAAGAALAWAAREHVPGGQAWQRTNHRGEVVTMLEGPAWVSGALAGLAVAPGLSRPQRTAAVLATGAAGVLGAVDDLTETGTSKGLRGHLGALRRGVVTTGAVKIIGISAAGIAAAALVISDEPDHPTCGPVKLLDVVVAGGVVAGTANLLNLLDLRPGRALKIALIKTPAVLAPGPGALLTSAAVGASLALIKPDLDERSMLGDCGANALGALLGVDILLSTASTPHRRTWRAVALAALVSLTVASEKVSFTKVIAATPVLRELDALGRRPVS